MSWTKREIVEEAFGELALAAFDFDLTPEELQAALRRLDAQMAMWNGAGIVLGYAFGLTPADSDLDQDSGLPLIAIEATYLGLACRLASSKGKAIPARTSGNAKMAYDALLVALASDITIEQQLNSMTPLGAGNRGRRTFVGRPNTDPLQIDSGGDLQFLGT